MPVTDERLEALEKLASIAALGGINMAVNAEAMRLEGEFEMQGRRSQVCFVRPAGVVADKIVVTFYSPCMRVKKGFLAGLSKDLAVKLLRRNDELLIARYGLMDDGDAEMVVASADYLLDTLDPEEFEHAAWHVALAADACERELNGGRDDY